MKNSLLVHKHLIIRAEASRPPTDEEQLKNWMTDFIESINMKVFMGPYVKYCSMPGNRGITAVAIIETSHIATLLCTFGMNLNLHYYKWMFILVENLIIQISVKN
jgi:S-adenosylmethionine/arginine decarboxylase-like enzyme